MTDVEDVVLRLDGVFMDPFERRQVNEALRAVADDSFDESHQEVLKEHVNTLLEHADDVLVSLLLKAGVEEALLYMMGYG